LVEPPTDTYVEEGVYSVTITRKHATLKADTSTTECTTNPDQQITTPVAANLPATGNENAALAAITGIATFTDPAGIGNETTADLDRKSVVEGTSTSTGRGGST